jgi:hypothetical protein
LGELEKRIIALRNPSGLGKLKAKLDFTRKKYSLVEGSTPTPGITFGFFFSLYR